MCPHRECGAWAFVRRMGRGRGVVVAVQEQEWVRLLSGKEATPDLTERRRCLRGQDTFRTNAF